MISSNRPKATREEGAGVDEEVGAEGEEETEVEEVVVAVAVVDALFAEHLEVVYKNDAVDRDRQHIHV